MEMHSFYASSELKKKHTHTELNKYACAMSRGGRKTHFK